MWQLIIAVAILVGEFIYHASRTPDAPAWSPDVGIPLTAVDSPVPLVYGRYRITAPILTHTSPVFARQINIDNNFYGYEYFIDMMFVLGIPFQNGTNHVYGMWISDTVVGELPSFNSLHPALSNLYLRDLTGYGNFEDGAGTGARFVSNYPVGNPSATDQGCIEYLNGWFDQQLVDPTTGTPTTEAGKYMTATYLFSPSDDQPWNYGYGNVNAFQIPGYRGYMSVFLWSTIGATHWSIGIDPRVNPYSFEIGTYPSGTPLGLGAVGIDCNPIEVIYDLLTGGMGKLGLDSSAIDLVSFTAAGLTLAAEQHGFSRCFDQDASVEEMLAEICKQIDAVMFEEPTTGQVMIKLIRPDYDPASLTIISPENCEELQNFAASGWTDLPNRVVLTFTDRVNDYKPGNSIAFSQANGAGQNGQIIELALTLPGITTQALADFVAGRVLAAASRPLMKCRAIVNRSFYRARIGDTYKLTWPEANISEIVMRVANVNLGVLEKGTIALDLVQDSFYTHRNFPPQSSVASSVISSTHFGP